MTLPTPASIGWLFAYVAMLIVIVIGLGKYRETALSTYSSKQADAQWQQWREAAEEMGRVGPVQRRKPKSAEPPPLVLMRDHYAACLGISLLLSSCLFGTLMIVARGAMRSFVLHGEKDGDGCV